MEIDMLYRFLIVLLERLKVLAYKLHLMEATN